MAKPGIYDQVSALIRQGRAKECVPTIAQLVLKHPGDLEILSAAAQLMLSLEHYKDALMFAERAVAAGPNVAMAHKLHGVVLTGMRLHGEAEKAYRRAIELDPSEASFQASLVGCLRDQGRLNEAIALGESAARDFPDSLELQYALLSAVGDLDSDRGYQIGLDALSRLGTAPEITQCLAMLGLYADGSTSESLRTHGEDLARELIEQGIVDNRVPSKRDPRVKPVIGLVSSDFRGHAVANFLFPFVKALKSLGYTVYGYQYAGMPDAVTERFKKLLPLRHFLPRQEHPLIQQLVKDRVEMLFDLNGYTSGGFPALFVQEVCPCRVHYLGFPGTTGMPGLRFRIADTVTDSEDRQPDYSERLMLMEPPFLCFESFSELPPLTEREPGPVRFGSFNNFKKLSRSTAELWAKVLQAVPESQLLLKSTQSGIPEVQAAVLERFDGLGVSERITFLPCADSEVLHLAAYQQVDIGLDPTPYNGTTTTCEALAMGVPVVSLAGEPHRSRVGATLIGHSHELGVVAQTLDEFVAGAARLAEARPPKEVVRQAFLTSPLCDQESFARRLGPLLEQIWSQTCSAS